MGLVDNLRLTLGGGGCEKLIRYQAQATMAKGGGVQYAGVEFSVASFKRWMSKLVDADALARALDDFQYLICKISREIAKDDPDRRVYRNIRVAAASLVTELRGVLEAFKLDPEGQKGNLESNVVAMRQFNESVVKRIWTDQVKGAEPFSPPPPEGNDDDHPGPPDTDPGISGPSETKTKRKEKAKRRTARKSVHYHSPREGALRRKPKVRLQVERVEPSKVVGIPARKIADEALRIAGLSAGEVDRLSKEIKTL